MGLESINFCFQSEELIEEKLSLNKEIKYYKDNKYVFSKDASYWIDLEILDKKSLSIRITLCNPTEPVLEALFNILTFLLAVKTGLHVCPFFDLCDWKMYHSLF